MGPLSAQRRQGVANGTELPMEVAEDVGGHVGGDEFAVDAGVYA